MAPRKQGQKKDFAGIKAMRISSVFETNSLKLERLSKHFSIVHFVKNEMSKNIFENQKLLLSKDGRYQLLSQHYKQFRNEELSAWETQQMFADVADGYVNTLKKHLSNHPFSIQSEIEIVRYKKDISSPSGNVVAKKGDLKAFNVKLKKTRLTKLMCKLIELDPSEFDNYTTYPPERKKDESTENFQKRWNKHVDELKFINRIKSSFIWGRIKAVVWQRQNNALKRISVINYNSGSYRKAVHEGSKASAKCSHVAERLENGKYKYFYRFKIAKKEVIYVPLAVNKKYHDFENVNFEAANYVTFGSKDQLFVYLQNTKGFSFKENVGPTGVVGIDLNVKDNFATVAYHNHSVSYDYDRSLILSMINNHRDIDRLGYKNLTDYDLKRLGKVRRQAEAYFRNKISEILTDFEDNNVTDIVMEDLNFAGKVGRSLSKEFSIPYSRLVRLLRLGSVKQWFRQQANNKGIRVHFVNPAWTSMQCSKCGFVHRQNRNYQAFKCINGACRHEDHADANAAASVRSRFVVDVLRKSLLEVDKKVIGDQFCGKKMSRSSIRTVIMTKFCRI